MRSFFQIISSLLPFGKVNSFLGSNIIIPLYHLVSDFAPAHVRNLYPVLNTKRFEKDLEFFLRYYTPISGNEFFEYSKRSGNPSKPSMMLTFDDGFAEINDVVAPILLKKGIPAVFFITPSFIDNQELMFRCKISIIIETISSKNRIKDQNLNSFLKTKGFAKINDLLRIDNDNPIIDELAIFLGIDFADYLQVIKPYLTTTQLVDLSEKGFLIGGHGFNHSYFKYLTLNEQIDEVKKCMDWLIVKFPNQIKLFAFPFTDVGVHQDLFNNLYDNRIVDLTFGTSGIRRSIYPKHFQRIPMEVNNYSAKKIVGDEILYYLAKQTIGVKKMV